MVPSELKSLTGVEIIISEIKKYDLTPCKFKICLPHIKNVGYKTRGNSWIVTTTIEVSRKRLKAVNIIFYFYFGKPFSEE